MAVLVQILATVIVCFPCLNLGIIGTLPSSTIADFSSPNTTTLQRPMTKMEVNLYGSLASAGALVGTPFVAVLLDRLGRKYCTVVAGLAGVLSWAILATTTRIELILLAVFIGGGSGVSFLIVPAYCSEFCQESIRGTMTAGSMVFYGVGTLVSYLLGGYLEYKTMVFVAMGMAVVQLVLMAWLKESPTVLLKNGDEELAAKSIAFYRQVDLKSKLVTQELSSIRKSLNPAESKLVPENDDFQEKETSIAVTDDDPLKTLKKLSVWQSFKTSQPLRRGFLITLALVSASIFQGVVIIQVFAEPIFEMAASGLNPTTCSLWFAVVIVVASVTAAYLSDLVGRRPLIIYSSVAASACCVLIGLQCQLHQAPDWCTAALVYILAAVFSLGGGTVPFVVLAEVFLPEVKSIMTMLAVEWMWLCYFLGVVVFYPLVDSLSLAAVFYIFAAMCILTSVFSAFFVPETKGVTLDEVQRMLAEKRNC